MSLPTAVFVGGFLGAGKTTLLLYAAEVLRGGGRRVALLMNDQDEQLVDTAFVRSRGWRAGEVGGGCFCCRFTQMESELDALARAGAEVILAEPVGSCIDLVTTLIEPLRRHYSHRYRLAPLTVLIDPEMAARVQIHDAASELKYLFDHQIREADLLCTTKQDLHSELARLEVPIDFQLSTRTGHHVQLWLDEILSGRRIAGAHPLHVDYEEYARAEAALAWLNLHLRVTTATAMPSSILIGPFLDDLQPALASAGMDIAHLKLLVSSQFETLKVSICRNECTPELSGNPLPDPANEHHVALNLRAVAEPDAMHMLVMQQIEAWATRQAAHVEITHARCFRPPPPRPAHLIAGREAADSRATLT